MVINSADEYEKLLNAYTLQEDSEIILQGFPRTLSFSRSFPESCVIVKTFIKKFYQFIQGFTQNYGEMDDLLKKVRYIFCKDINLNKMAILIYIIKFLIVI